jgi:VTC domain.
MNPITLDEMQNIRLMDRVDSKYVASVSLLPDLLRKMIPLFKVQEVEGERFAAYTTQYLDTPELSMFEMHQNGKLNRQKIRIRSYTNSKLSFLEIKNKNNKGRTNKKRIPVDMSHLTSINELNDEKDFLGSNSLFDIEHLRPSLTNEFNRITFVNNKKTERITIDINLSFRNCRTEIDAELGNLMILELKQDGWKQSDFRDILNELRIKQTSFSKYCIGTVLTNPGSKYNRFKEKTKIINKLI